MPWTKAVVGVDGKITQVWCKVCSDVETREKLLVPKIDSLWKYARRRKALVDMAKVKKGEYYYLGSNQHVKNKRVYHAKEEEIILKKLEAGIVMERCKKLVQMKILLHLLFARPANDRLHLSREALC